MKCKEHKRKSFIDFNLEEIEYRCESDFYKKLIDER